MKRTTALLLVSLLAAGCSSPGPVGKSLGDPPRNFEGYPSQTLEGSIYAQARFDSDYRETFGTDLIATHNVIPVLLKVQQLGETRDETVLLLRERMEPRLYLQDGTALENLSADKVASMLDDDKAASKVRKNAFEPGLVGSEPIEGYVYFALTPKKRFQARGRSVVVGRGGITKKVDVANSLLAFTVTVGNAHEPFYVGIQR